MNHLCKQVVFYFKYFIESICKKERERYFSGFYFSVKNKTLGKAYSIDIDGKIL